MSKLKENKTTVYSLDRSALCIWAKEPFVEWLNTLPDKPDEVTFTLEGVVADPGLYLIPAIADEGEVDAMLATLTPTIFLKEFERWCENPEWWPKDVELEDVDDWFDYQLFFEASDLVEKAPQRTVI